MYSRVFDGARFVAHKIGQKCILLVASLHLRRKSAQVHGGMRARTFNTYTMLVDMQIKNKKLAGHRVMSRNFVIVAEVGPEITPEKDK